MLMKAVAGNGRGALDTLDFAIERQRQARVDRMRSHDHHDIRLIVAEIATMSGIVLVQFEGHLSIAKADGSGKPRFFLPIGRLIQAPEVFHENGTSVRTGEFRAPRYRGRSDAPRCRTECRRARRFGGRRDVRRLVIQETAGQQH